jgi:hypothetical protein
MRLKNSLAYCVFLFFPFLSPTSYFEKKSGTTGNDFSRSVKQLSDGSIYLFGNTDSGAYGGNDLSLTKLDHDGNQLWTKYYGTSNSENGFYLNTTADHQLVFVGECVTASSTDILIYKVDTTGTVLWNKSYATSVNESANYIEQTTDGGYIIAGSQNDSLGYYDLFVLKLNANGDYKWHRTFGPNRNEYAKTIHETTDGYILVGDTGDSLNNYDITVFHLDTLGNKIWSKSYGDSLANGSQGIISTSDGNYLFYGETEVSPGSWFDAFLEKIDKNGNSLWKHKYGGTEADAIFSVVETTDGGFACTGYSNSYNNNQPLDLIILKTDASGKLLWQQTYGGTGIDIGYELVKSTADNGYIITGKTFTTSDDCYLLSVNESGLITSISSDLVKMNATGLTNIYPNPARDNIFVAYELQDLSKEYCIVIDDGTGRQLKNRVLTQKKETLQIDLSDFDPGVYICSLFANHKLIGRKKFIVK